ncbi:MAG: ferric reductase-like transmembrane domain-containing protein [Actinobacteria bacterium]|nr:ferric reductase-like transmembrane domain-containing protein [Actinomycetota bacterium]
MSTHSQLLWFAARAAGLVSWGLLTASVVWGLALSTRALGRRPRPAWLLDLHRALGGLAVIFTGVHVVAIMLDSYVHFGLAEVLVPFASSWHPVAVAWGIAAFYLLAAVEITSLLRSRLPNRIWRRVHYASFPLFVFATVHGLSAGTDTRTGIAAMVTSAALVPVIVLVGLRLQRRGGRRADVTRERRRETLPVGA